MIVRDSTAAFRRADVAGVIPSLSPEARLAEEQPASRGMARAIQLAAGGLVTLGLLLAGWGAWNAPVPRSGQALPAPAGAASLAPPAVRETIPRSVAPTDAPPVQHASALPATALPVTLSVQHAAILTAAGPATPDAVRTYLASGERNLLSVQAGAITGPGRAELLLMGAGRGCASCHHRWIAVWDVERQAPLWEADDGVDTVVSPVGDGLGFVRTDAVWSATGPECCHAMWENRYLTWDGATFVAEPAASPFGELAGMPARARP